MGVRRVSWVFVERDEMEVGRGERDRDGRRT